MTDWTPEEERVAKALYDGMGYVRIKAGDEFEPVTWETMGEDHCDDRERFLYLARAAIAAMSRWRDVKTDPPPRDGWHILARLPDANTSYVICWTDKATGIRAELCHDKNPAGWRHAWDGYFFGVGEQPTHWMPLPPAPEPKP